MNIKVTSHDQPINQYIDDQLGRQKFVKNLAKSIDKYSGKESFVIGLYGEWGTGKTSLINMLVDYFDNPPSDENLSPIIIKFNPWYFSGQDHLIRQFFNILGSELDDNIKKIKQDLNTGLSTVGKSMKKFSEILEPVNKFIVPFIPVPLLGETTKQLQQFMNSVGSAISEESEESLIDPIKLKEEISEQLRNIDKKILIIIDDIDRLNKDEIKQIFQLVKSLADFSNTIYLLSFSPEVVTKSLEEIQGGDSRKYLEKIIQYPIEIPGISQRTLENLIGAEIHKIVHSEQKPSKLYEPERFSIVMKECDFRFYFSNLREVFRFLNIFKFNFDLIGEEVNTVDLIIISAIQSLDTKLYSFIKNNKELFVGGKDKGHASNLIFEKRMEQKTNQVNDNRQQESYNLLENQKSIYRKYENIKKTLEFIFPNIRSDLTQTSDGKRLAPLKSVAYIDYFDYYFQLSLPDNKLSQSEIDLMLSLTSTPDELSKFFGQYLDSSKISGLIDEISIHYHYFICCSADNEKYSLIHTLIVFDDKITQKNYTDNFRIPSLYSLIKDMVESVGSNIDINQRLSVLKSIFEYDRDYLSYSYVELLTHFALLYKLYDENLNRIPEKINIFDYSTDFIDIEKSIVDKVKTNIDNKNIFENRNFLRFVDFCQKLENNNFAEITEKISAIIKSDNNCLINVLEFYISSQNSDRKYEFSMLDKFIFNDECKKHIKNLNSEFICSLSPAQQEIINRLSNQDFEYP